MRPKPSRPLPPPLPKWQYYTMGAVGLIVTLALVAAGVYLLYLQQTGVRAEAKVSSCERSGSGRYATVECYGSWTVGGALTDGGHIEVGTIQGTDESDIGHTVQVTVHGEEAYSLDRKLPLLLIGFGLMPPVLAAIIIPSQRRLRRLQPGV